jgi:hypothetical protein
MMGRIGVFVLSVANRFVWMLLRWDYSPPPHRAEEVAIINAREMERVSYAKTARIEKIVLAVAKSLFGLMILFSTVA